MRALEKISIIFIAFVCLQSGLSLLTNVTQKANNICNNPIISSLATWDSTCHYRALFAKNPDARQILIEHEQLKEFSAKNGFSSYVRFYRYAFYKKYRDFFEVSIKELDDLFWAYYKSAAADLSRLAQHAKFLSSTQKSDLAQQTIDRFCTTYADKGLGGFKLYSLLAVELNNANVAIPLDECHDRIPQQFRGKEIKIVQ